MTRYNTSFLPEKKASSKKLIVIGLCAFLLLFITACTSNDTLLMDEGSLSPEQIKSYKQPELSAKEKAAQKQYELAMKYFDGQGIEKDEILATQWFKKAAKQDHPTAQAMLGMMYHVGTSAIKKDQHQSINWLKKAANQGQVDSQFMLGTLYLSGKDFAIDTQQAEKWFQKAAEQGHALAQKKLDKIKKENVPSTLPSS